MGKISLLIFTLFTSLAHAEISCKEGQGSLIFDAPEESVVDCTYYLHRELDQQCGPEGYYIGFGYKYCTKLMWPQKSFYDFSDKAYLWLTNVGLCLQKKLHASRCEAVRSGFDKMKCADVNYFAMQSHVGCYLYPDELRPEISICNLNFKDYPKLANIIKATFLNPEVWKQMKTVAEGCARENIQF